ncbi:serine hydroxymethyltransferase [Candidatus Nomurabacteria bacterium]|uniref:Serine hydroxymethyltransferase n=1 Tax=candidate division WWE3 bacterium TaxID=2053526 RepID=A0A955DZR4_UNCKA|nr:serine hydroxymethyltransferase [candidate division WWE3 bacterium]MCB9823654.1 serine hydroxymethyltransferase [Candidatus Nomurabacteria bacterium]MCB9827268.1 serine hydroxymethyltransferase [Candidatus Nomurabacteria bacterium]MCB9827449.1 serine hydroxymethyltransferase [Candidatus Nomurabacteria bacterium]HXK52780.1 serine hydroxymethyltransferase [bacterium]
MDKNVNRIIKMETRRQRAELQLIPSENYVSKNVLRALGSVFTNKYAEGYPEKRYYQGNKYADQIEKLAIQRAKILFDTPFANVQANSGSPANLAVLFALLDVGDTIMGMSLSSGGHLTHGHPKVTLSGKFFNSIQYGVSPEGFIDYKVMREMAHQHKPKLIISGGSAYSRTIDFKLIGEIAKEVGAYHMADISHIAGLVVAKTHPSPTPFADIITTTTHKTLRGPRGALILTTDAGTNKDPELASKIDKAIIPGTQGGPHLNNIAGIAVALGEAQSPQFTEYINQVVLNSKALCNVFIKKGYTIISGGTDTHLLLLDVSAKNIDGWAAAWALEYAGVIVNRNIIPFDTKTPFYPSGIRLGSPALTSRGMKEEQMEYVATIIDKTLNYTVRSMDTNFSNNSKGENKEKRAVFLKKLKTDTYLKEIKKEVADFASRFPIYPTIE